MSTLYIPFTSLDTDLEYNNIYNIYNYNIYNYNYNYSHWNLVAK